jgi:hypothetical protein
MGEDQAVQPEREDAVVGRLVLRLQHGPLGDEPVQHVAEGGRHGAGLPARRRVEVARRVLLAPGDAPGDLGDPLERPHQHGEHRDRHGQAGQEDDAGRHRDQAATLLAAPPQPVEA